MKNPVDKLVNGLEENQRKALGNLSNLAHFLESDGLPNPEKEEVARLLEALESYLPDSTAHQARTPANWLRLARSQFVLFEGSFWLAGASLLLLGLLMTVIDGHEVLPLALVLLAPLLSAAGVAYAFRPETRTLGDLEHLTATSPAELLYTRLALVLAFNMLISLLLLLLIWLEGPQLILWRLTLVWLGPLLALTGLALYTTIRWGSLVGIILPLGLWGSLVLLGWREVLLRKATEMTPVTWLLLEISRSDPLLMGSILACIAGIGLLILAGQVVPRMRQSWN
jgi:hypothetical protein